MPSSTTNYNLTLYDRTTDAGELFLDYRDDMGGTVAGSNMNKIDTQMKVNADAITDLEGAGRTTETVKQNADDISSLEIRSIYNVTTTGTDTYTGTSTGITAYYTGMRVKIIPANDNTGASTVNINTLGAIQLVKVDETGANVALVAKDLRKNKSAIFEYNGSVLVGINLGTARDILIADDGGYFVGENVEDALQTSGKNSVYSVSDVVNTNTYVVTTGVLAYFVGWKINLTVENNNTENVTLNPDGLGAQSVKAEQIDGTFRECQVDEISGTVQVEWDGTQWKLISAKSFDDYNRPVLGGVHLINGDFQVWQDGTSFIAPSSGVYNADGYFTDPTNDFEHRVDRVAAIKTGHEFACRIEQTNVTGIAGSKTNFIQKVDGLKNHEGREGTFTVELQADVGVDYDVDITVNLGVVATLSGTGDGTLKKHSLSHINPATLTDLRCQVIFIREGVLAGEGLTIQTMKYEPGKLPTRFLSRPLSEELRACQRYFWKTFRPSLTPQQASGQVEGAIAYINTIAGSAYQSESVRFPVPMRTIPTITLYNPINANSNWHNSSRAIDSGASATVVASEDGFVVINNPSAASDVVTDLIVIHATASARL